MSLPSTGQLQTYTPRSPDTVDGGSKRYLYDELKRISLVVNQLTQATQGITDSFTIPLPLTQIATQVTATFLGNISGGAAAPVALTATQVTASLNAFTTTLNGLVPTPGSSTGKFLRDDASWQTVITSVSFSGLLLNSNNLSDVSSASTARTNLGLLSAATHASTDFLSSTVPCFKVHKNGTNQTGVVSNTSTLLTWGTVVYDIGSHFASNGWTPPAGKVSLGASVFITGTFSAGALGALAINKNGTAIQLHIDWSVVANDSYFQARAEDVANGTDVYTVVAQNSFSSGTGTFDGTAYYTNFYGHWISP